MALEAVIYPQTRINNFGFDYILQEDHTFNGFWDVTNNVNCYDQESASNVNLYWDPRSSPEDCSGGLGSMQVKMETLSSPAAPVAVNAGTGGGRRKRRRTRNGKNKEELENQRMTHITVERNRRKQMNEYLAVIRSLMPASYVQRGDQASIVGGAINFVKELEQQLQTLQVQKRSNFKDFSSPSHPFGDFFTFPQYSIFHQASGGDGGVSSGGQTTTANNRPPAMAEIEVTLVESQANVKILSKKRRGQLLKLVAGLKCLWLVVLHLNVTTIEEMVLYTLSVKLEDGCQLSTVDEIADAVNCLLGRIEGESLCSN